MTEIDDGKLEISKADRNHAHRVLDTWFEICVSEATHLFSDGHSGYVGAFKLRAFVEDDGVRLRIERSFEEDL